MHILFPSLGFMTSFVFLSGTWIMSNPHGLSKADQKDMKKSQIKISIFAILSGIVIGTAHIWWPGNVPLASFILSIILFMAGLTSGGIFVLGSDAYAPEDVAIKKQHKVLGTLLFLIFSSLAYASLHLSLPPLS